MAQSVATAVPNADRTMHEKQRYIAQIESRYVLIDRGAVWQFLFAHPRLAPILLEAYDLVQEHLPESRVELRVIHEPEAPDWGQLLAVAHTSQTTDQALDLLRRLDEDWFEKQPPWIDDLLILDVEHA